MIDYSPSARLNARSLLRTNEALANCSCFDRACFPKSIDVAFCDKGPISWRKQIFSETGVGKSALTISQKLSFLSNTLERHFKSAFTVSHKPASASSSLNSDIVESFLTASVLA